MSDFPYLFDDDDSEEIESRTCCDTTNDEPHECSNPSTNPEIREEDE